MNLLLIGNFVVDKIIYNGEKFKKPGGIYYSSLGLNLLCSKNDTIKLLTQTDIENRSCFKKFNFIDEGLIKTAGSVPNVQLTIFDHKEREEKYLNFAAELDLKLLTGKENFDGILINMITGNDITINNLTELRRKYNSLIYLDIHSLVKKLNSQNKMELRRVPDIEKWFDNIDILQANEIEAKSIIGETGEQKTAEFVLSYRPQIFIITKGSKGSVVYYKSSKEIKYLYCKPVIGKTMNKVGCGDIYGAAFFYNYLLNRNAAESAMFANTIAGLSTKFTSEKEFINELKDRRILK